MAQSYPCFNQTCQKVGCPLHKDCGKGILGGREGERGSLAGVSFVGTERIQPEDLTPGGPAEPTELSRLLHF